MRVLEKLRRKARVTIVALGDSNTELTWHTAGRLNWVGLLQYGLFEKYGPNVATVINAGRCGDTAPGGLARLDGDVIRFKPDLVIIAYGMNDAGRGEAGLPAFRDAIRQIVEQLRHTCDGCEMLLRTSNPIVVSNQSNLPKGFVPGAEWPGFSHALYAKATVELASELGCAVVDHYTLWTRAENRDRGLPQPTNHLWNRMSDATHPVALGHLCFYRELAPLFELRAQLPWEGDGA